MIAAELRRLAAAAEHAATSGGARLGEAEAWFVLLGLAAELDQLAGRVAALEAPGGLRLLELPTSVADLAAARAARAGRRDGEFA